MYQRYTNVKHSLRSSMVHGSISKRYVFVLQLFIVIHYTTLHNRALQIAREKVIFFSQNSGSE
jgi:hypothetical protein